ncbi:MAG TPA: cysteine desulfurase family protein, partial [Rhizomicrobium sp.]|nr:cysteine desulfurase family protein [Rhizomicrobium sp.]
MTYLDHNATSPLRPEARAAMERAMEIGGNPSSIHAAGRAARALIEKAREQVAALANARPQDVIFTSGGTEANASALSGAIYGAIDQDDRFTRLFVSAIEHDSVLANAHALAERVAGLRIATIPVTADGAIDTEALRVMLREGKGRTLIAAQAANNETGVIQPVAEIARLAKDANALLLVDAIQAAGKIELNIDADYLSLSSHKIGGPQGVGALIVREGTPFAAQVLGGGQERNHRAGTENVIGVAGFGAAAAAAKANLPTAVLRDRFERDMTKLGVTVFGAKADRLANTSNFALPEITAETALMALDLDGVMVSSGAACSSGKVKTSHVLKAMNVADDMAARALRVSFGWNSTEA